MASAVKPRDVSPLLQKLREFLLGRKHTPALRFDNQLASRSPPPPVLPDGPCHEINKNYYYSRDVRREVKPPLVIASTKGAISDGGQEVSVCGSKKLPTPGKVFHWD